MAEVQENTETPQACMTKPIISSRPELGGYVSLHTRKKNIATSHMLQCQLATFQAFAKGTSQEPWTGDTALGANTIIRGYKAIPAPR